MCVCVCVYIYIYILYTYSCMSVYIQGRSCRRKFVVNCMAGMLEDSMIMCNDKAAPWRCEYENLRGKYARNRCVYVQRVRGRPDI